VYEYNFLEFDFFFANIIYVIMSLLNEDVKQFFTFFIKCNYMEFLCSSKMGIKQLFKIK